jgi:hypothetical protein
MWIVGAIFARRILVYNSINTMKAKILSATKTTLQEDGSEFLDIAFEIRNEDGEVLDTKRRAFPLDTPAETIQTEIAAFVSVFESDRANAEKNKERDAIHAKADKTIDEIVGKEVAASVEN